MSPPRAETPREPLRPGDPEQVGPYRLIGRLGEGGQGSVFLAEDEPGNPVAVKLLHARFTGDAKARSRFAAELAVAKRITPFCTARILDADVEGRTPYIVSEFIDGPSLSAVLAAEGPRSGPALVRVAVGTITALAAIHDAGVVHRDFKPSNVLMAPDGPRVIDFGIARALDATGTLSSTAVGTPAYMAPEQISGAPVGPEADIFAWGASMVYASTGRAPFGADSIPAVMHRVLNLPPDLGALPAPLRDLVGYCLIKDPAQRPTAQQVLLQLLGQAGALPDSAQPSTMLTQGAEMAAAHTPPSLGTPPPPVAAPAPAPVPAPVPVPAPWPVQGVPAAGGGWVPPPPGPSPYSPEQAFPAGPGYSQNGARRSRKGIGILAGSAAAGLVALILVGVFIVVELNKKDDKPTVTVGRVGGDLRMVAYAPTHIDPSNGAWGSDRTVAKQLYTGLVEVGADGSLQNRLAGSVQPAEGCRTWTIRVRTGTTFSNGEPVDARALVRGWTRAAQTKLAPGSTLMADIEGYPEVSTGRDFAERLKIVGDEVQVRLTAPDCEFNKRLADPVFFPVPSGAGKPDNAAYNDRPIGNGPFVVESYTKNQRLVLARNAAWAFGKTKLDRVSIDLAGGDSGAKSIAGVQSGIYDWADVSGDSAIRARAAGGAEVLSRPSNGVNFLVPITDRGPMKSKEARLAVSYALDRKALADAYAGGLYPPATGLVPQALPGFKRSGICPSCEASDPAKAKVLAEQAGLKAGARVRLLVRDGSSYARWGVIVQQQLQRTLGWQVSIIVKSSSEYTSALSGKDVADLIALGWIPDYPSALSFLEPILGGAQLPPKGSNYGHWRSSQFDAALRAAKTSQDPQSALSSLQNAEKMALDDMALIPVWNLANVRLASKKFVNLQADFEGDPTLATAALR